MLFNSLHFLAIFFPVVSTLYFLLPHRFRWVMLLCASCYFYMSFIPVYILILGVTIVIDYTAGIFIERTEGPLRKVILTISVISTCGVLFIFKYFNFFNSNFAALADLLHWNYSIESLSLILPIGLSFHTFQSLSYVIEVYRRRQKAEYNFGIYSLYVMFYPQLVAGPIERPQNLLHQFYERHEFDYDRVTSGLKLMLWGLFKKVVIADRLAVVVNTVYTNPTEHAGLPLIIGTVFFAFQIYCDFSGYSEIAIGSAQVMGFKLMDNFNRPYYAKSISEFWKRWHISLSTWFKDYLYISLGGNRVSTARVYLNLFITFLVSGLWHGANWTYVVWGALNGFYLIFGLWTSGMRSKLCLLFHLHRVPKLVKAWNVFSTFSLICFAWIFFRANNISDAFYISTHLFSGAGAYWRNVFLPNIHQGMSFLGSGSIAGINLGISFRDFAIAALAICFLECVHLLQRQYSIRAIVAAKPIWIRWSLYYSMLAGILVFGQFNASIPFIYFQF
jgi:alginate O-acetyltransferase complex protein AlgI